MKTSWIIADKEGIRQNLGARGFSFVLNEMVQNAIDENITKVEIDLPRPVNGSTTLRVTDDSPDGWHDLSHSYTMFAESCKRSNPEKRGRFKDGEEGRDGADVGVPQTCHPQLKHHRRNEMKMRAAHMPEADDGSNGRFSVAEDGHYVGDDGWVVPKNFDEFYERYPKYVLNWVKRRLNRFSVDEQVEDWTQDLLVYLKYSSAHLWNRGEGRPCCDVIEAFDPFEQGGASERRFRYYLNSVLAHMFDVIAENRSNGNDHDPR